MTSHYPIRAVAELTGVPGTTLRAWERRYGLLKPRRTAKGHRQYDSQDIELIKNVVGLLKNGHTISQAVRILRHPELRTSAQQVAEGHWRIYQQRILRAVESFHPQNLDKVYNEALALYPIDMVTEQVIIPVLDTLGEHWRERPAGIAEEHFFSTFLRNKLGARLHHEAGRSRGSRILVSCLPGEYHELGVLLFCIAAMGRGYQILYLGPNLPPDQLPLVLKRTGGAAILLSGTQTEGWDAPLRTALHNCLQAVPVPVMFGGAFSSAHAAPLEALGGHVLGAEHGEALAKLEATVAVFPAT